LLAFGIGLLLLATAFAFWQFAGPENRFTDGDAIEALLADYADTWQEGDSDAFRSLVTEDFRLHETIYQQVGSLTYGQDMQEDLVGTAQEIGRGVDFEVKRTTDLIISGRGPWFVSFGEDWIAPGELFEGTASYSIVEENGELRIGYHYWAGLVAAKS
jgi:hypothetical protein